MGMRVLAYGNRGMAPVSLGLPIQGHASRVARPGQVLCHLEPLAMSSCSMGPYAVLPGGLNIDGGEGQGGRAPGACGIPERRLP